jgi:rhamnogalacturonyl hydrolase YesR
VRDTGWPLIAFSALYEATRDERWLTACRRLVAALLEVGQQPGGWGLQLGWHKSLSPLHLGIVMTGLSRYHRLTGDAAARAAIIQAADQMLTVTRHPDGALMYVDAPGWRRNYSSGVAFESLGYVWELTGDRRYLEAGWVAHRRCLTTTGLNLMTGTALADWWRGLLRYLAWADQAGVLTDLSL